MNPGGSDLLAPPVRKDAPRHPSYHMQTRPTGFSLVLAVALVLLTSCLPNSPDARREKRVEAAVDGLARSEGGRLLAKAINAHGGLDAWFRAGDLKFRWTYRMLDRGPDAVLDTVQVIDLWSSSAVHEVPDTDIRFGWTGEQAWIHPGDAEAPVPPHFWALTPYYFVGIPFVLADPGTNHERLDPIEFEGTSYEQVKVTYDDGTGQTPDDYYIALIDPNSNRVRGVRYIVTDSELYPDGPSPEKLLTYEDYQTHGGVLLPSAHRSFEMNEGSIGEFIREADVSEVAFLEPDDGRFAIPEGAKIF